MVGTSIRFASSTIFVKRQTVRPAGIRDRVRSVITPDGIEPTRISQWIGP
jgi:hypothetical protein